MSVSIMGGEYSTNMARCTRNEETISLFPRSACSRQHSTFSIFRLRRRRSEWLACRTKALEQFAGLRIGDARESVDAFGSTEQLVRPDHIKQQCRWIFAHKHLRTEIGTVDNPTRHGQ